MVQRQYSDAERAAVMAALLQGQSTNSVANKYNIPRTTIRLWRADAGIILPDGASKKDEIGNLVIEYLKANLATLKIQTEQFQDRQWLAKQDANQVAILHGVLTDKAIRLLEALTTRAGEAHETAD